MLNPRGPVFMTPPRLSPPLRFNAPFPRSPGRGQFASHWFPRPGSPYPGLVGASQAQNFNSTLSSVPEEGGLLLSPGAASLPPPQRQMRNSLPVALLANGGGGGGAAGVQPGQDGRRFSWSHQDFYSPRPGQQQQQQQNNTLHGNRGNVTNVIASIRRTLNSARAQASRRIRTLHFLRAAFFILFKYCDIVSRQFCTFYPELRRHHPCPGQSPWPWGFGWSQVQRSADRWLQTSSTLAQQKIDCVNR